MMARLCELSFLNLPSLFLGLSSDSFSQTFTYSIPVGRTLVGLTFKGDTLQTHLCTYPQDSAARPPLCLSPRMTFMVSEELPFTRCF